MKYIVKRNISSFWLYFLSGCMKYCLFWACSVYEREPRHEVMRRSGSWEPEVVHSMLKTARGLGAEGVFSRSPTATKY